MNLLSPARWQQIKMLLDHLFDLPPEEHTAFLDQACHDDPALYDQLKAALDANRDDHPFFEVFDAERFAVLMHQLNIDLATSLPSVGQRIGSYQVVDKLARGGMGEVFLAERADGTFEQQVALKLVKRGLDSEWVHRRFAVERQILARLRHEHIAQLFDGGVSATGQPYFVMEYIDGKPITEYCDEHQLTIKGRLRLLAAVCEAVQYAHRNLVVHRDLKPSNILVTKEGQVKLLDFGIAKLLKEDALDETALTRTGGQVMTPEYAAPEQVRGETITTATDVYALGVLLYELLTGHRPYHLKSRSLAELERVICETQPDRPSTVIGRRETNGTMQPLTPEGISQARGMAPEKLRQHLSGDLDTIALKALRKEPERRYPSAEAFLEDIKRHLAGLPVSAQPDTWGYRARKFVGRHRVSVAAAAVVGVLLALVGVLLIQWAWQADQIRQEARKLETVQAFLVGLFKVSDPWSEQQDGTVTARALLDRGVERIDALEEEPEVQAKMLHVLGVVYRQLGMYDEALPLAEKALALRQEIHGENNLDVAKSLTVLAWCLALKGDYDKAEVLQRKALTIRRELLGNEHPAVAASLNNLAWTLREREAYDEAEALFREALTLPEDTASTNPYPKTYTQTHLAAVLMNKGEYEESERLYRQALATLREDFPDDHPSITTALNNLAALFFDQGDYDEAERLYREALARRRKRLGEAHPEVANGLYNVAVSLLRQGAYDEAELLLQQSLSRKNYFTEEEQVVATWHLRELLIMKRKDRGPAHPSLAVTMTMIGEMLVGLRTPDEAEPLLRQALQIRRDAFGEADTLTAASKRLLGSCLAALANYPEAELLLLESLAVAQDQRQDEATKQSRQALADLYTASGKPDQAALYQTPATLASAE